MTSIAHRFVGLIRRTGWGFADQALSSLTNFALGILVARAVPAAEFGAFGLAFSTYLLFLGIARSLTSDCMAVRYSASGKELHREATADSMGASIAIGVVGGLGCVIASRLIDGTLGSALLGLGLTLPGLLAQDGWRFVFFSAHRGVEAFKNDLIWAIVLFAAAGSVLLLDQASVFWFVVAWGGSATVAAVAGVLQAKVVPRVQRALFWLRSQRDLGLPFLGQFAALIGGAQLSIYGVASLAGLAAAGSFRAVGILMGPVTMLHRGIRLTAVPDTVRTAKTSPAELGPKVGRISSSLAAITLVWGLSIMLLPDQLGRAVLGDSWEGARAILLALTLSNACGALIAGIEIGLRSLAAASRSFRARAMMTPLVVGCTLGGAVVAGAMGAAWGHLLAYLSSVSVWAWQLHKALGEGRLLADEPAFDPMEA